MVVSWQSGFLTLHAAIVPCLAAYHTCLPLRVIDFMRNVSCFLDSESQFAGPSFRSQKYCSVSPAFLLLLFLTIFPSTAVDISHVSDIVSGDGVRNGNCFYLWGFYLSSPKPIYTHIFTFLHTILGPDYYVPPC